MTLFNIIVLALVLSILLTVFGLGLQTTVADAQYLVRRPAQLTRAVVALFVIVPAFALVLCLTTPLSPIVKLALVALAVSPVPPILPLKQMKAGAERAYTIGLLVAASLIALVVTPLLVAVAAGMFDATAHISPFRIAKTLLITVGAPLAVGMTLRGVAPRLAETVQPWVARVGTVLMLAGAVALVVYQWPSFIDLVGNGTLLAMAAVICVGLIAGHLLGPGTNGEDAALAMAASTRHPGVALAIMTLNFPVKQADALTALVLFLVLSTIVRVPYLRWIKSRTKSAAAAG